MNDLTTKVIDFYSNYMSAELSSLAQIYATQIKFQDPLLTLHGIDQLTRYFEHSKQGLKSCSFDFSEVSEAGNAVWLEWVMRFSHGKLQGGRPLVLRGSSLLKLNEAEDRVIYHRDYYDVGEMLYEHLPLLGAVVRSVRRKAVEGVA